MSGTVSLVGAGPGDAGLITRRGLERLREADVVVYDRLTDPALLRETQAGCELIDAGKAPRAARLPQEQIDALLVARAQGGARVVRLKGGDPYIFGRGAEELAACRAAGAACEVIPGVSSALAAPAAVGIPVTLRGVAQTVTITTFRGADGVDKPPPPGVLSGSDTLCILMGREQLGEICQRLIAAGRSPGTPAALIERATWPGQRAVRSTLADLPTVAEQAALDSPAVIVVGQVVAHAPAEAFESVGSSGDVALRPLAGRRVVVTRPESASGGLIAALRARGATVIDAPLIEITHRDPGDAWPNLSHFDWLVFTSLHGVRGFCEALWRRGLDCRALGSTRIAVVGPKTGAELGRYGLRPDLTPTPHRAEALVEAIVADAEKCGRARRVLFPAGTLALDEVPRGLRAAGFSVEPLIVYETHPRPMSDEMKARIAAGVDAILLYSPSAAQSLAASGVASGADRILAVGPTTAAAAEQAGLRVGAIPETYGDEGMLAELEREFAAQEVLA